MDQIQIQVAALQVIQGSLEADWHVFFSVAIVPQLASDEKLFSLDDSIIECSLDAITNLFLVSVVDGLIDTSVSSFNGSVYSVSGLVIIDLPATESNGWHSASSIGKWDVLQILGFHLFFFG